MDPARPDAAGEYALQLTEALAGLAAHADLTVIQPGFRGSAPAADILLLPAGGQPQPGYRCFSWLHDLAPLRGGLGGFRARFRSAFSASRSDLVLAPSEAVAEALRRYLRVPPSRLAVVKPGLGPGHARTSREDAAAAAAIHNLPERYLLAFGDEGIARRAWAAAERPASGAGLVLAEALAAGRETLPALLSGAVGVLLAEPLNGNPMRALQAMACGSPPIVPDDGAFPEVVRDGGLTVRTGHPEDWAEAISALFRSRLLRAQLSGQGRQLAAELTAARAARKVLELVEAGTRVAEDQRVDPGDLDRTD
ncbi:MAG TPA: glycosyltransferase [Candidatus Dormibacteraeota bacterium]|nr:glycosyltransferase [Candidatus Dormibacteraeota bacterium]